MIHRVISSISGHFSTPIAVTGGVRAFADGTLGISNPRELLLFMATEEAEDTGLIQLLIHPPRVLKEVIEEHIPPFGFSNLEITNIKNNIMKEITSFTIIEPETGISRALTPTAGMIGQFLADLHLDSPVPAVFPGGRGSEPPIPPRIRCRLRRHWHRLTDAARNQIMILAESLAAEETGLEYEAVILKKAAALFENLKDTDDPYEIISRQKQASEKLIDTIKYFEEMQKKYSMDILMSMRLTPPPENYDDLLNEIKVLDRISGILFGIPARGRAPEENIAMEGKKNLKDLW